MTVTGTSAWSSVVHAAYHADYINAWLAKSVWMKLVNWRGDLKLNRGSTQVFPVNERLALVTSTLSETSDVTPVTQAPTEVSVTIEQYGNAVQKTYFLDATTYTDAHRMVADQVGENMAHSMDKIVRTKALANTYTYYPAGCTARTDLDSTNDVPIYGEVTQLTEYARSMEIPPLDDGTYVTIVPFAGAAELKKITEITAVSEYSDPQMIYSGMSELKGNEHFPGELFKINNLRVVAHNYGKVYLGAGSTIRTATTLNGAVSAGDTTITVTTDNSLAVGDYLTIGTVESGTTRQATTEQVRVTGVGNTPVINIQGAGTGSDNFGLKFAHDSGATVTCGTNVFAMPVFGKDSLVGYYDGDLGIEGQTYVREHQSVLPEQFWNYSWKWLGGVGIVDKYVLRGEFATSMGLLGVW